MPIPKLNTKKVQLAKIFKQSGLNALLAQLRNSITSTHARVINYHDMSSNMIDNFETQLKYYHSHFVNIGRAELDDLLIGKWKSDRPGIIITFDDGFRSHAEYAAPLLEKYGFTGWFFLPTQFVDTPVKQQWDFAAEHDIIPYGSDFENDRIAISWEQVSALESQGHIIGCHTWNHQRLGAELSEKKLIKEIVKSKAFLEAKVGHEVDIFCWVGGEENAYSRDAATLIRKAGYHLSFMTNHLPIRPGNNPFQLQRTNIEAYYPMEVVEFQLSGFLDMVRTPKRVRVNRLTSAP